MEPQFFKGDDIEKKYYACFSDLCDSLSLERDDFFAGAFECFELGSILWDSGVAPLSNAIPREIFRSSFFSLFESFEAAGSAESYISVFKQIFGRSVLITFGFPGDGKLTIAIEALGVDVDNLVARIIANNAFEFDKVTTQASEYLMLQIIKGFESEYALRQMLYEMVPAGIFTTITLTLG